MIVTDKQYQHRYVSCSLMFCIFYLGITFIDFGQMKIILYRLSRNIQNITSEMTDLKYVFIFLGNSKDTQPLLMPRDRHVCVIWYEWPPRLGLVPIWIWIPWGFLSYVFFRLGGGGVSLLPSPIVWSIAIHHFYIWISVKPFCDKVHC